MSRGTGTRYQGVKCFLPKGRTASTIYVVSLVEHPNITKVGRSQRWHQRRRAYDYWNFANGDAVADFATFTFIEEYVDLPAIEAQILASIPFPLRMGKEWFDAPFDDVRPVVEEVIESLGIAWM